MYIVVVGCGRVGYHFVKALSNSEHEVLVIEKNASRWQSLSEEMGSGIISGDGCEAWILESAGASRADVLIALTGNDEDNLASCQLAKHMFRIPKTISLVNDPDNEPLFKSLGVDATINSTDMIMSQVEEELPAYSIIHLSGFRLIDCEIVEIKIPPDASVSGKLLKDIDLPEKSLIPLIISRDGQPRIPTEDTVIQGLDAILAVINPRQETQLRDILTKAE